MTRARRLDELVAINGSLLIPIDMEAFPALVAQIASLSRPLELTFAKTPGRALAFRQQQQRRQLVENPIAPPAGTNSLAVAGELLTEPGGKSMATDKPQNETAHWKKDTPTTVNAKDSQSPQVVRDDPDRPSFVAVAVPSQPPKSRSYDARHTGKRAVIPTTAPQQEDVELCVEKIPNEQNAKGRASPQFVAKDSKRKAWLLPGRGTARSGDDSQPGAADNSNKRAPQETGTKRDITRKLLGSETKRAGWGLLASGSRNSEEPKAKPRLADSSDERAPPDSVHQPSTADASTVVPTTLPPLDESGTRERPRPPAPPRGSPSITPIDLGDVDGEVVSAAITSPQQRAVSVTNLTSENTQQKKKKAPKTDPAGCQQCCGCHGFIYDPDDVPCTFMCFDTPTTTTTAAARKVAHPEDCYCPDVLT